MKKQDAVRTVGPETARMLELGHPWVVADAYTRKWPTGNSGQSVELCDSLGRFLATALLDPDERIVARVLERKRIQLDRPWLTERLKRAIELRRHHAALDGSTAYRVVNAEGDGLPGLTVDRYADYLMLQLYSFAWRPHLKLITQILQELLSPAGIYEKSRPQKTRELEAVSDNKNYGRLLAGKAAPQRLEVLENGLTFLVSLEQGLNTGLFLDQRRNRRDLMTRVKGKRVLNLFAYTGAFSVAAAAAGAVQVTSVDASAGYTDWSRDNFAANRINPKQHAFIVGDCLAVLSKLAQEGKRFDVILMDPPSFSTTTKSRFTTRGGTSDLVAATLPLLTDNGLLITASNHQKVDTAEYLKELRRGALQADCDLRVISLLGQPEDFPYPVTFPEGRYLKYATCVKSGSQAERRKQ
ncbi:MAG: class I SAM-dependent rRNA methyltransferase [Desulfuromonadaceae bacterium]|nr:class I SAM-dependent rRNA methyltransferase [Desulfuromonadaceae bacterium]MDD2847714.1 class I SAM-dependent rRNA methyltransferase [Desulfuromonadaceae bacterium]MDD4131040.1 class I SAM-dependent rRNA methyltransferase [Desulfuromonadaceae bacterium]